MMRLFRYSIFVYLIMAFPVVIGLELPLIGSYLMIKSIFFSFAEKQYYLVTVIVLLLIVLGILLLIKKYRIYDIIMFIFILVDFVFSLSVLFVETNYIAIQSIVFDLFFIVFIVNTLIKTVDGQRKA